MTKKPRKDVMAKMESYFRQTHRATLTPKQRRRIEKQRKRDADA